MIPKKLLEVLENEGVVAIATWGENGPHLVNTWNSYITIIDDEYSLFPAGKMNTTEANVAKDNRIKITIGSKNVDGFQGKGTGFLIEGTAAFLTSGSEFDIIKQKFSWARAAVKVKMVCVTQTL